MVIRDGETELKAVLEEPAHAGGRPMRRALHGPGGADDGGPGESSEKAGGRP